MKNIITLILLAALCFTQCSDQQDEPSDMAQAQEALQQAINTATDLYNNSEEGTGPGQHRPGSRETLNAVIAAAQAVIDASGSTLEDLNNAIQALNSAIEAFNSNAVAVFGNAIYGKNKFNP